MKSTSAEIQYMRKKSYEHNSFKLMFLSCLCAYISYDYGYIVSFLHTESRKELITVRSR